MFLTQMKVNIKEGVSNYELLVPNFLLCLLLQDVLFSST